MPHNTGMDVVRLLQELAKHPLPDDVFATVARALVGTAPGGVDKSAAAAASSPEAVLSRRQPRKATKPKREDPFFRFTVHDTEGRKTTLCLQRSFVTATAPQLGGSAKLAELVRQLSRQAPLDLANRSGWVQDQILRKLSGTHGSEVPRPLSG